MKITTEQIITDTDPRIREKSVPVPLPLEAEDAELLQGLLEYVRNSQDEELAEAENLKPAVGIAAIQVGVPRKLIAVVVPDPEDPEKNLEFALANPKIIPSLSRTAIWKAGRAVSRCPKTMKATPSGTHGSKSGPTTCCRMRMSSLQPKDSWPSACSMKSTISPVFCTMTGSTKKIP